METVYVYSSTELPKFLCDLGKSTKRGIKKCPKCGTYNGTRGIICKNKSCDALLKDCADKRQISLDAVRLVGIVRQVYSVRVKDRGPDHRGFVQLPLVSHQNQDDANQHMGKHVISENGLCFVDSCQRQFDDSILKCHEAEQSNTNQLCVHIDCALKSQTTAIPIEVKSDILKTLKSEEIKEKLWLLATEKEGPLVQRVSRTVMAVKCQVTPKHPLGYLHFTFLCTKGKEIYDKYYCSCTEFMNSLNKSSNVKVKCVHYYACICALASDAKYSEEFSHFVNNEFLRRDAIYRAIGTEKKIPVATCVPKVATKQVKPKIRNSGVSHCPNRRHKILKKLIPKIFPVEIKVLDNDNTETSSTSGPVWTFQNWLTYVTESINQTMQFENYGTLNTLSFSIPEIFYEEIKKRIPSTYTENPMIPNVFHVMNILHLKQIFDTPDVKLKISKRFVHDVAQNIYVEYDENQENDSLSKATFIFFLNVGQSTVDESDNTNNAFVIEWLPYSIIATQMGQIKFQYKYGRKST